MSINIPNNLPKKQLEAFMDIVEKLLENQEIDTLFFSGSFYHGHPNDNSDLDFIALTHPEFDYFQRVQGVNHDVFYELFIYSKKQLKKSFELIDYQDMHMVGHGFLVFSKSQDFEDIKDLAKSLFEKGPAKISNKKLEYEEYLLWDKYKDIQDIIIENPNLAKSLLGILLWDTLRLLYVDKCIWFPKQKRLLESLIKVDNNIYGLVCEFINSNGDAKYLLRKNEEIIEKIIYPRKLATPFIWQSEKKIL